VAQVIQKDIKIYQAGRKAPLFFFPRTGFHKKLIAGTNGGIITDCVYILQL
jgi:hypothetical protein